MILPSRVKTIHYSLRQGAEKGRALIYSPPIYRGLLENRYRKSIVVLYSTVRNYEFFRCTRQKGNLPRPSGSCGKHRECINILNLVSLEIVLPIWTSRTFELLALQGFERTEDNFFLKFCSVACNLAKEFVPFLPS